MTASVALLARAVRDAFMPQHIQRRIRSAYSEEIAASRAFIFTVFSLSKIAISGGHPDPVTAVRVPTA